MPTTAVENRPQTESTIEPLSVDSRTTLRLRHWESGNGRAGGGRKKTFVFLNGLESHSLWASPLAEALCERGHRFVGLDRRGSGLNSEVRGSARDWLDDVLVVVERERARDGERPVYLVAQCFGARLAIATVLRRPEHVDGLILLSPGLAMSVDVSLGNKILIGLGHLLGLPIRLPSPIADDRLMTADASGLRYLAADPLRLRRIVVSDFFSGHVLLRSLRRPPVRSVPVPCLALFAHSDRIVDVDGTSLWLRHLFGDHLTIRSLGEADHLLLFGRAADQTVDAVIERFG